MCVCVTVKLVVLRKIQSFPSKSSFDRAFPGMPKNISHLQRMTVRHFQGMATLEKRQNGRMTYIIYILYSKGLSIQAVISSSV